MTAATRRTAISRSASGTACPDKWPTAYAIISKMNLTNLDIAVMSKLVDIDGMEVEEAADKWLADNEAKWMSWVN